MYENKYSIYITCDSISKEEQEQFDTDRIDVVTTSPEAKKRVICISDSKQVLNEMMDKQIPVIAYVSNDEVSGELMSARYAIDCLNAIDYNYIDLVYHRTYMLPMMIAQTERLIIRELSEKDANQVKQIFEDKSIARIATGLYNEEEELKHSLRRYYRENYQFFEYGYWGIFHRQNDEMIGLAGFSNSSGNECLELGYAIRTDYRHKGYAQEAVLSILSYITRKKMGNTIEAVVEKGNVSSIKLLKAVGFTRVKEEMIEDMTSLRYEYCR